MNLFEFGERFFGYLGILLAIFLIFIHAIALAGLTQSPPTIFTLVLSLLLIIGDGIVHDRRLRFASLLHELLKDIGQRVSEGNGVESAIFISSRQRSGPPSRIFSRALSEARDEDIESVLTRYSHTIGPASFREACDLLAIAIPSGGHIGRQVHLLGERLANAHALERETRNAARFEAFLLRLFGLVVFPFLLALASAQTHFELGNMGGRFFLALSVAIGIFDAQFYASTRTAIMRQPIYLAIIFFAMHFGLHLEFPHVGMKGLL